MKWGGERSAGRLPGIPYGCSTECFGETPDAPRGRYPEASGAQAYSAFHRRAPDGRKAHRRLPLRRFTSPPLLVPSQASAPGRTTARLYRERDPARSHPTAASGRYQSALPVRWGAHIIDEDWRRRITSEFSLPFMGRVARSEATRRVGMYRDSPTLIASRSSLPMKGRERESRECQNGLLSCHFR
jgi:hypothetical protein